MNEIDRRFCRNKGEATFNYYRRNQSTSHVQMILATAIAKAIDASECLFFLSSENSVSTKEAVTSVSSPWIHYELQLAALLRKQSRTRRVQKEAKEQPHHFSQKIPFTYPVPIEDIPEVTDSQLKQWAATKPEGIDSLGALYGIVDKR